LVCVSCGKVVEFQCPHCSDTHRQLAGRHGFRITGSRVELFGYCQECTRARSN
jgi:Fe2+ or Zn2+ uptake regulation protein